MVALASATRPLRKPGADTVRQMPGSLRQEPGGRRRVSGVALMAEADVPDPGRLCEARQIGDRNADDAVDGLHVVGLQRVDDHVDPVGHGGWIVGALCLRVVDESVGHDQDFLSGCARSSRVSYIPKRGPHAFRDLCPQHRYLLLGHQAALRRLYGVCPIQDCSPTSKRDRTEVAIEFSVAPFRVDEGGDDVRGSWSSHQAESDGADPPHNASLRRCRCRCRI